MKEQITILVVDHEPKMRNLLERILSRDGYRVSSVGDGSEALARVQQEDIAIVIADMSMPGMNGLDLLKTLKANHPRTAVIMMTANGDTYTLKDALLLGADEYITKPFKSFEISMVVERAYWRQLSQTDRACELN